MVDSSSRVVDAEIEQIRLTEWTSCGGCAAKWGAALLADLVREIGASDAAGGPAGGRLGGGDPSLLIGLAPFDDAAIYRLTDDIALVSTTDFFPPLVDHPGDFGAIAAANACSDVFAMGGRVVLALNVAAFPESLPRTAVAAIFAAAAEVVAEAGGTVAGGHTIRSEEPIFGLAVQGVVHPERVLTKRGAKGGDVLVLSKPIGTGIVLAGASEADKRSAIAGMRQLNRAAAELLVDLGDATHAVTDVTGYGLAGHGWEMAERSGARLLVDTAEVPLYPGALAAAEAGTRTGGDPRNRDYVAGRLRVASGVPHALDLLAHDPQTSGGLLAAIEPAAVRRAVDGGFTAIGRVEPGDPEVELR
ncbi:MAG: selenide, water dikinase SelD [Actinomycetota bacterium]|nr:selenide, water dikinase SelD [Actinomycetota bacterium]